MESYFKEEKNFLKFVDELPEIEERFNPICQDEDIYFPIRPKLQTSPYNGESPYVGIEEAITEVKELSPDNYEHVERILSAHGFERGLPLNDKWQLYLKQVVMPIWGLLDVQTLRPMNVKNVVVECTIKVRVSDLLMEAGDWRVISDGKWHEAEFTDKKESSFQVRL